MLMRHSTVDDLPRLKELAQMGWEGSGAASLMERKYGVMGGKPWIEWKFPEIENRVRERPETLLVTEVDGKVVGFISFRLDRARGIGMVGNNTVDPACRGMGIGTEQVGKVMEIFREEGMKFAEVTVALNDGHAPARRIYDKFGFEPLIESSFRFRRL